MNDPSARVRSRSLYAVRSIVILLLMPVLCGQSRTQTPATSATVDLQAPPRTWAVDAAHNEMRVFDYKEGFLRYRLRTLNNKGDQTRDIIETRDGSVARLVLRDGRPLAADEDAAEQARLQSMLGDPAAFHKHIHEDGNGKRTAADLIRLLPDAMLYTYAVGQPQRLGTMASEVVLDFQPNPAWSPPTTISEALTGLNGRLWIDAHTRRLTHLDCNVFRGINIGFGMLAHVNPGGSFTVDQIDLGQGRTIVSHFTEHVTLRALVVKSMHENADVTASQFEPIEAMSYTEAIHRLLDSPLAH